MSTRVLITNDDGIDSPGLHALAEMSVSLGLDTIVVAPSRESSGASASLGALEEHGHIVTQERRIDRLDRAEVIAAKASPALIVRACLHGAFGPAPDLVLSGINRGANTGHAVLHSGTVGAAMTAATLGSSALAVSLDTGGERWCWDSAVAQARPVVEWMIERDECLTLNLNVPNREQPEVRGRLQAPLASFGAVQTKVSELGHGYVRLEYKEIDPIAEPDSDAALLARGWACLTALEPVCEAAGVELGDLVVERE